MKIIVNLNAIKFPLTGIGYYTRHIVFELLKSNHEVVGIRHANILRGKALDDFLKSTELGNNQHLKNFSKSLSGLLRSIPGVYFFKHFFLSLMLYRPLKKLAKSGYVYFEPSFVPFKYQGKTITTIHDLSFISHSDFHPEERVRYLKKMLNRTLKISDLIVVDSNFIKDELCALFPNYKPKINTLYLGVDDSYSDIKTSSDGECLELHGLFCDQYVLSVGTLEPRKNLPRLIEAYALLPYELRGRYPLVLVGDAGWKNSELEASLKSLVDEGHVKVIGYVSDDQLKCLYRSAAVFIYPSLYEGFGLPVIEAMSSGTAVITSDIGATKEISGDFAVLVNPFSIEDISNGLLKLLSSDDERAIYCRAGFQRQKLFSWKRCANNLLDIIK